MVLEDDQLYISCSISCSWPCFRFSKIYLYRKSDRVLSFG